MARNAIKNSARLMTVPGSTVSLLTAASKMPSASWSLPAIKSCPGAQFGKNAICGTDRKNPATHNCYARKNLYRMRVVQNAQDVRYRWALMCMVTDYGFETFVSTMVRAITADGRPFFRVHDSGDMFNARYARAWREIATRLPGVKFWIPTRSWRIPSILPALIELSALPNVSVRPSALKVGEDAPTIAGLSAGTGVKSTGHNCPASTQGNRCGECRACWDKSEPVYYHLH